MRAGTPDTVGPGGDAPARPAVPSVRPVPDPPLVRPRPTTAVVTAAASGPAGASPSRRATASATTATMPIDSSNGTQTIAEHDDEAEDRLAHRDQGRRRPIHLGRRVPPRRRLGHGHDLGAVRHGQRRVRRLVLELRLLRGQPLDLAPRVGEAGLDLEEIADLRGLLGVADERRLAGLQVPDPGVEIDELAGDLDGVRLLADLGSEGRGARRARPPSARRGCGTSPTRRSRRRVAPAARPRCSRRAHGSRRARS